MDPPAPRDVNFALLCKFSMFRSGVNLIWVISPNISFHSIKMFIQALSNFVKRQVKLIQCFFLIGVFFQS